MPCDTRIDLTAQGRQRMQEALARLHAGLAAGTAQVVIGANGALAIPIKAQVGLGPTLVGPVANAGFFDIMTVCWHVAP